MTQNTSFFGNGERKKLVQNNEAILQIDFEQKFNKKLLTYKKKIIIFK